MAKQHRRLRNYTIGIRFYISKSGGTNRSSVKNRTRPSYEGVPIRWARSGGVFESYVGVSWFDT